MSTVQPETTVALAEKVRAKGATFVECPVGGTVGPAREGKLLGVRGRHGGGLRARQAAARRRCAGASSTWGRSAPAPA